MATIELRIAPAPGFVRTVRLVATAVARRAGMDEARVDELRLAVGEACARAVRRCEAEGVTDPVLVEIEEAAPGIVVQVTDQACSEREDEPVVLALLRGLADGVEVGPGPRGPGGCVRLEWLPL